MQEGNGEVAFDQLIDEVSDLIFLLGGGLRILYLNRAVERTLGWPTEGLIGQRVLALIHPEDRPLFRQSLREEPSPPELSLQVRVRTHAGEYRLLRLRATLQWRADGTFRQARVIAQDVTEQVALRHAHSSRATHFSALMDLFQQEVVDAPPMHLLQSLLELAIETIPDAQRGTILLRRGPRFHFVASVGWPLEILQQIEMPSDDEHNELLRRSGIKVIRLTYEPQQLLDLGETSALIEQLREMGTYDIKVSLRAPILLEGELYGYFNLDNLDRPSAFDDLAQEALILFAGQAAVSLKYQRLLDQLAKTSEERRRHATRQSLLARIATIINSTLDLQDVFDTSLALISEAIEVHRAGIVLFDWRQRVGNLVAQWSDDHQTHTPPLSFPLPASPELLWPIHEATPIMIEDPSESPYLESVRELIEFQNIRSMLLLPLVIDGEVGGLIGLSAIGEPRLFSPEEIEFADTIRQQITVAIERARLYEQAQQRVAQVEALHQINLQTTASLELRAVLHSIATSVLKLIGGTDAHIFLYNEARDEYQFGAYAQSNTDRPHTPNLHVRKEGLTSTVARARRVVVIEDAAAHPLFQDEVGRQWGLHSAAGVPLVAGGQVLGILNIAFTEIPHHFTEDELRLLELFAGQGALAIQNARLFERERLQREGLEALHRTALAITSIRDRETLIARAVEESSHIFRADAVAFWGWDSSGEAVVIRQSQGLSEYYLKARRLDSAYLGRRDGGFNFPLIINDLPSNTQYPHPAAVEEGIHHALTVPIRSGEVWLGALVLYNRDAQRPFRVDDLQRATALAAQLALGLENATHFEQATQRADLLMALNDVMLEVSRELGIEAILKMIVGRAASLVQARGEILRVEDYDGEVERSTEEAGDLGPRIAIPLRQGEEVIGVISFSRGRGALPFSPDDRWLLELFAKQATVALTRARMVDAIQRQLQDLLRLRSATLAISQQLDPRVLQRTLVGQACTLLGCTGGFFFQSSLLRYTSASLAGAEWLQKPAREMAARVTEMQQPLVVHEADGGRDIGGTAIGTMVGLPLRYGETVLGVMVLVGEKELRTDEHFGYILNLYGTQAAIAFENARLYQQSEELKQFNENIIQWMDEGILMLDERGFITYANRASEALLGYAPGSLIGRSNRVICHPDDHDLLQEQMRLRQEGQSSRYEIRLHTAQGEALPVIISAKPLFNMRGEFDKSLVVFTDISDRKRLEQQLIQADKLSAVGRLVSGVAHELNNPLTSIIGYTQLIGMSIKESELAHDVERIQSEARRAARIVKNLLAFARQHRPEKQLVDINQLLQSTLDLRAYHLKLQDVTLVWELTEALPLTSADPHQLQQVVMNLVTNAEQAMAESGQSGTLTIGTRLVGSESEPMIQIAIEDTGYGMDEETRAHIFDPFFTTKDVGQGTGLGLSICFGIVQEHGGSIEVQSERGKGSAFLLTLPVQRALVEVSDIPVTMSEERRSLPTPSAHVLVIEDEPSVSTLVSQVLRLHGHQVTIAGSAEEALPLLRTHHYDLILSDLKMPGMGGQQLFRQLRDELPAQAERVIFMTGDTVSPDTHTFLTWSGRPYLAKPFHLEELRKLVEETLHSMS